MTQPLYLWQQAAVALVEHACGIAGRDKLDPIYREVTENRDGPTSVQRARYSSCGDLAWWLLYRLGLRTTWMNRAANKTYQIGMNVADLTGCPVTKSAMSGFTPEPGDICEIWNSKSTSDAHVTVILGPGSDAHHVRTGNYGAGGMSPNTSPGAKISDSVWIAPPSPIIGVRRVQRVVRLADIVPLLTAQPDLTGAAVTGELIDALGAKWSENV